MENEKIVDYANDLRNMGLHVIEPAFTWTVKCGYDSCGWTMKFESASRIQIEYLDHIIRAHGVAQLIFIN